MEWGGVAPTVTASFGYKQPPTMIVIYSQSTPNRTELAEQSRPGTSRQVLQTSSAPKVIGEKQE